MLRIGQISECWIKWQDHWARDRKRGYWDHLGFTDFSKDNSCNWSVHSSQQKEEFHHGSHHSWGKALYQIDHYESNFRHFQTSVYKWFQRALSRPFYHNFIHPNLGQYMSSSYGNLISKKQAHSTKHSWNNGTKHWLPPPYRWSI